MTHKAFLKLRELLIYRRQEIFKQVAHLEAEREELGQSILSNQSMRLKKKI